MSAFIKKKSLCIKKKIYANLMRTHNRVVNHLCAGGRAGSSLYFSKPHTACDVIKMKLPQKKETGVIVFALADIASVRALYIHTKFVGVGSTNKS